MPDRLQELERHFALPRIETVEPTRPLTWVVRGWKDMMDSIGPSLAYGLIIGAVGIVILWMEAEQPYLLPASLSCYLLVAPFLGVGLYEISRRRELGESATFGQSIQGWGRNSSSIGLFGVGLMLVTIFWERTSAILFALLFAGQSPDLSHFTLAMLVNGRYFAMVASWVVVGAALAALVFALSAVSLPMMLDRGTDPVTAMMTSVKAVGANPVPMALWAAIIVALIVVIGFATLMIGMIVVVPALGHATWHAYRDLVRE
jgi:uncharacterized membrane protein